MRMLADASPRAPHAERPAAYPGPPVAAAPDVVRRRRPPRSNAFLAVAALSGMAAARFAVNAFPWAAAPGQAAGYARHLGFDPRRDVLWLAALAAGAIGGARLCRWTVHDAGRPGARRRWNDAALAAACVLLAVAIATRAPLHEALLGLAGWGALALAFRRVERLPGLASPDVAFVAAHALALWTFLAGPAARAGLSAFTLAPLCLAGSLVAARALGRGRIEEGAPRLAAALLALPLALWGRRPAAAEVLAAGAVLLLPAIFAAADPGDRALRAARRFAGTVFLPATLAAFSAAACLHGPPLASFFEDGHALLPASEYLRGELPFRDIVPGHGLLSDGLLQAAEMRVFGEDYRGLARGAKVAGLFFWPILFALGCAATGGVAPGFWTAALAFFSFPQFYFLRSMASLACLALAVAAARKGTRRSWALAGAALPAAVLLSIDFASYAGVAALAALLVSRRRRPALAGAFLAGLGGAGAVVLAAFAGLGFAPSFLRATLVQIPALFPAYALGFPPPPAPLASAADGPALAASLLESDSLYYWFLGGALLLAGILVSRAPACGPRGRVLLPVVAWFLAANLSVAERQHCGYAWFVAPLGAVLCARWWKGWGPWRTPAGCAAAVLVAATLAASHPLRTLSAVGVALSTVTVPPGAVELTTPRRAAGALFPTEDAEAVRATGEFLASGGLAPSDTWLDFSNAPILYFLFDRDCPIRYYEVAFFQTADAQREVIAAISRNPRVKAVLVATGRPGDRVDGIPNAERAPLVDDFIRRSFHPAYRRGGVEFWLRNRAG